MMSSGSECGNQSRDGEHRSRFARFVSRGCSTRNVMWVASIGGVVALFGGGWVFGRSRGHRQVNRDFQALFDAREENETEIGDLNVPLISGGPGGGTAGVDLLYEASDLGGSSCHVLKSCDVYVEGAVCQCNQHCSMYQNCCLDRTLVCNGHHYSPSDPALSRPSSGELFTFYMYRTQSSANYPPLNVNMASMTGALWYLQNEVVSTCMSEGSRGFAGEHGEFGYRRWKISRILRYKVTMRATTPLLQRGMNFGTRVAFDSGKNTGSWEPWQDMNRAYDKYGYNVGCNVLGDGPYPKCPEWHEGICPIAYAGAVWYSVPGPCPSHHIGHKTSQCVHDQPGGYCTGEPTGQGNCTFTYEAAGEVDLDELSGITPRWKDHTAFCRQGCSEWVKYGWGQDRGKCGINFWDHWHSKSSNAKRVEQTDRMFKQKYPDMPMDRELPPPPCDFNKGKFYWGL